MRKKRKTQKEQTQTEATPEPSGSTSLFAEEKATKSKSAARAQNRLTHAQLRELEAQKEKEVMKGFKRLRELWWSLFKPDQEEAEREWLVEAEKLVDMFRETRNLFLTSRVRPNHSNCELSLNRSPRRTHSVACSRVVEDGNSRPRRKRTRTGWHLAFSLISVSQALITQFCIWLTAGPFPRKRQSCTESQDCR